MKYPRIVLRLAFLAFSLFLVQSAFAAVLTVTNANDDGAGSMRAAILTANTNNEDDTINFDPAFFNVPRTILLTSQGLVVDNDGASGVAKTLTIDGPGANLLTIDGNDIFRVFRITAYSKLTLSGVKVTRGAGDNGGFGGAFLVGSGIPFGEYALTLRNCIVSGNRTVDPGYGGAIYAFGWVLIENSTISDNYSPVYGGGISAHRLTLINSTVSGNTATLGGGIYGIGVTIDIVNSTIAYNTSTGFEGGGIYANDNGPVSSFVFVRNSIISQNNARGGFHDDASTFHFLSSGNNVLGDVPTNGLDPSDQLLDPKLDPNLSLNGGIIPVHALHSDSPAIDKGNDCVTLAAANGGCLSSPVTSDQRGVSRPQDGDGNGTATVDIGPFEAKPSEVSIAPPAPDLRSSSDSGVSNTDNITTSSSLIFDLTGLANGAAVELMRDGAVVASATASGSSLTLSDLKVPTDRTYSYTVRQTTGGVVSLQGPALKVITDTTRPSVTMEQALSQADPARIQPVNYTATFSEPVFGFDGQDIVYTGSTANTSSASAAVTGAGPVYNVAVGNVTSDGSIVAIVATGSVVDAAGNIGIASTSADNSVTLDTASPTVTINQAVSQADPVRTLPVNFTVVFNEPVTGFTNADVSLAGSSVNINNATIAVTGSGTTFNVAINGIVSNGGFVRASVVSGAAADLAGNPSLVSTSTDNQVTIDNVGPAVSVNQAAGQSDPTNVLPVNYTVTFNEPVTGFSSSDVSFAGSQISTVGAIVTVTGNGAVYNVAISNITSNGSFIRMSVPAGGATDALGNLNTASVSSDSTITVDNVAPGVTINQSAGQIDPASNGPVNFTAQFSESVTGFSAAGISLAGSTANVSFAQISVTAVNSLTYTVSVGNITSRGTVKVSILADAAQDIRGNKSLASTSTDNTVTFNFKPLLFDFDGDRKTDVSIFRPSVGVWWYLRSIDNADRVYQFGNGTDKLTPADFTGDGKTDVAFFRPSTGEWYVQRSEDNQFYAFSFGAGGDIAAPGDFDGDGKADAAVFRPSIGTWFILRSSGGVDIQQFGTDGDVPMVADYDGDGRADIGIYRPSLGQWWVSRSSAGLLAFQFGTATDKPVPGDYTGDGKTDIAIWRPSTGEWFVLTSETFGVYAFPFGTDGDIPAPGDYDGDGKADAAVFRPSIGTWFILGSTSGVVITQFGAAEDKPVPAAFIP